MGHYQMADGKTLVIGTAAQEVLTVDEDTLSVAQHPFGAVGNSFFTLFFPNVVVMANGKVLVIGQEEGIDSSDILEAGQSLYEWDPNANAFTQLGPPAQNQTAGIFEVDSLARSGDHKWAVFAADRFYLYSSDSDSLTTVPLTTVNPPQDEFGVRGYAINADGTKIAVASATQVTFLDHSLTAIATAPIPGAFQTSRTAVQFSPDGRKLFLQYSFPVSIEEIDATTYSALGYVSGSAPDDNLERLLTIDAKGQAYVGIDGGLRLVDLTQRAVAATANGDMPSPNCPVLNVTLPLNTPKQVQLFDPITGVSVYVAGQPAPLLNGGAAINIPASSIAGPADVECIDISGNTTVGLNVVSYGVDPVGFSANLLPPAGNPGAYLFGFGFSASQGETPSVTLGGQPALKVISLGNAGLGTLQADGIQVPNGAPGESADIVVSSSIGSGTLASAATYYPSFSILPASGLLQLLYDNHRNLLYALKATEVDVLNPKIMQWQSPLVFPSAAMGAYNTMALTPDGSKLVVAGLAGSAPQLIVLDPSNVSAPSVLTYSGNSSVSGSIAITKFNTVVMPGNPGLVLDLQRRPSLSCPTSAGKS